MVKSSSKRPIAFVLAATNHGTMLVNRNDYHYVGDFGYGVGHQILNSAAFDQEEVDFALQLLESRRENFGAGVVAIDCGANVGVHTIEWARLMSGWGEVVAIEAQERIFYALAGNITLNNCFNARAIWSAVGTSKGEIGVPILDYLSPSSFGSLEIRDRHEATENIGQKIDYGHVQRTPMIAIDDLELRRVDLIKIDIEGMELEALTGAQKTIDSHRPQLIIERIKAREDLISGTLQEKGYRIFPLGLNILAIHSSDPLSGMVS